VKSRWTTTNSMVSVVRGRGKSFRSGRFGFSNSRLCSRITEFRQESPRGCEKQHGCMHGYGSLSEMQDADRGCSLTQRGFSSTFVVAPIA
jgi:hypothetical protein